MCTISLSTPGVVSDLVCMDLLWKRREKAKMTIATSKPLGFVIVNLCVFQASAAETRVHVSQQQSLLSSLFTLCFAMFLTKFIFEILASLAKVARTALLCLGFIPTKMISDKRIKSPQERVKVIGMIGAPVNVNSPPPTLGRCS